MSGLLGGGDEMQTGRLGGLLTNDSSTRINPLASLFSWANGVKRRVSNPLETLAMGLIRGTEDLQTAGRNDDIAYGQNGMKSVLISPEQRAQAAAAAADFGSQMGMAGVIVGKPVNVFHGTTGSFSPEAFDLAKAGSSSGHVSSDVPAMWTSRSPKVAGTFVNDYVFDKTPLGRYGPRGAGLNAIGTGRDWKSGANVMPMKATLKNPYVINGADAERRIFGSGDFRDGGEDFKKVIEAAKAAGHDGVVIKANPRGSLEFRAEQYLLFDPASQAKSRFSK